MSNLIPIVTPAGNSSGNQTEVSPTAIFSQSMDEGTVISSSCFLVEISKSDGDDLDDYLSNSNAIEDVVPAIVTSERINLLDEDSYTGLDHGGDVDSGEKYRSRIRINPDNLLKPNTNYAVLLSKDLSTLSVFDPEPNGGNTGDGEVQTKGPYSELTTDIYTVYVSQTGTKGSAKYTWSRLSDGHISGTTETSGGYITIDRGLQIRFGDGDFNSGDSFTIRVRPADTQAEIYSWTYSTGSGNYQNPDDDRSDSVLDLPVRDPDGSTPSEFYVTNIEPANADTLVKIARKSSVKVGDVLFLTKEYTDNYNSSTIEFKSGGIAGSETVSVIGTSIEITIEDGESTAQQIIDAFNLHALSSDIDATSTVTTLKQIASGPVAFSKGVDQNQIIVTFNKDIDDTTVADKIKINSQEIYPATSPSEVSVTTTVSGNQLVITIDEL